MPPGMMEAAHHPGFDPGSGGLEASYAVPSSFTMDSGSEAGMTGHF